MEAVMTLKDERLNIIQQIKTALDGRTQRWLALNARIPETNLSRKMKGTLDFTDEEITAINNLLKVEIKREAL